MDIKLDPSEVRQLSCADEFVALSLSLKKNEDLIMSHYFLLRAIVIYETVAGANNTVSCVMKQYLKPLHEKCEDLSMKIQMEMYKNSLFEKQHSSLQNESDRNKSSVNRPKKTMTGKHYEKASKRKARFLEAVISVLSFFVD